MRFMFHTVKFNEERPSSSATHVGECWAPWGSRHRHFLSAPASVTSTSWQQPGASLENRAPRNSFYHCPPNSPTFKTTEGSRQKVRNGLFPAVTVRLLLKGTGWVLANPHHGRICLIARSIWRMLPLGAPSSAVRRATASPFPGSGSRSGLGLGSGSDWDGSRGRAGVRVRVRVGVGVEVGLGMGLGQVGLGSGLRLRLGWGQG